MGRRRYDEDFKKEVIMNLLKESLILKEKMIKDRRYIHENPEIGFELDNTLDYVHKRLTDIGCKVNKIGKAGLSTCIGQEEGKTILLRADMDALPVTEDTNLSFESKKKGYSHVCGHDLHTSMLLAVANILKENESKLKGKVKLMFQPAEEYGLGAADMVKSGILINPEVDAAIAIHVDPLMDLGEVEFTKGIASSSMDSWELVIKGKGGHSSRPHEAIDPITIGTILHTQLNSLTAREVDPFQVATLTVGRFESGTACNIIPEEAILEWAIRCYNNDIRKNMINRIDSMIESTVTGMRGKYKVEKIPTPSMYCSPTLCDELLPYVEEVVGKDKINISDMPYSATEDFSFITQEVDSMYLWLGAGSEDKFPLHSPNVVFNEDVMPIGVSIMVNIATNWLEDNFERND